MVATDERRSVDPRMILVIEFSTVFALAEKNLAAAGVHFGILGDVVDASVEHGPAIIFLVVRCDLLWSIVVIIRVLHKLLLPVAFT